jgi:ADP-ribose pyrophosphatase YjhB (NUDIX family)
METYRFAMTDPQWLLWARELQAMAQTGLAFPTTHWDQARYERLQALAADIMAAHTTTPSPTIAAAFAAEWGYPTPKLDVRGAVFQDGKILLVRETADHHRWTLPGGWADINLTPAENVVKEIREESGFHTRPTKLAAALDRTRQGHTPQPFSATKLFFLCDLTGGAATPSHETSEIAFFPEHALPEDLSVERTTRAQLLRMFAHHHNPALPTDFE